MKNRKRKHRDSAFEQQGGLCYWCGIKMLRVEEVKEYCVGTPYHGRMVTADHLLPSSRGGKDAKHNIVASCYSCNIKRGDARGHCIGKFKAYLRGKIEYVDRHYSSQRKGGNNAKEKLDRRYDERTLSSPPQRETIIQPDRQKNGDD